MTEDQMPEFVKLLATLSLSYGKTLNEFRIEHYWQTLQHLDFGAVQDAFQTLTTKNPDRGHAMPEPSDVLRCLEGSSQLKAQQAWGHVLKVIRQVGSYNSVVFDEAILHRVIDDMGGWIRLCETSVKELSFLGNSFQKLYMAYLLNPPTTYPRKLTGIFDTASLSGKNMGASVLMIGDPAKAADVYSQGADGCGRLQVTPLATTALPNLSKQQTPALEQLITEEDKP
jgi:hypothetical protein